MGGNATDSTTSRFHFGADHNIIEQSKSQNCSRPEFLRIPDKRNTVFDRKAVAGCPLSTLDARLVTGRGSLDSGQMGAAEVNSRAALTLAPAAMDALGLIADVRMGQGRSMEAVRWFQRAARVTPHDAAPQLGLGRALESLRYVDAALRCYRMAVRLRPEEAGGWIALANALRRWNRVADAAVAYGEALRLNDRNPSVWASLAAALQALGRVEDARMAYAHAAALRPDDADTRGNLGFLHHSLGAHAAAQAAFAVALALDPAHVPSLVNMGLSNMAQNRSDHAVRQQRRALRCDPERAEAWNNLGNALTAAGRRAEADAAWRTALALTPRFADALGNRSAALSTQDRFDEALRDLTRALRLMPAHPGLHALMGHALGSAQRPAAAITACRRALALSPAMADPLCTLGLMEQTLGNRHADRWFTRAATAISDHALARFNRGLMALERGELTSGWADYAYRFKAGRARPDRRFTIPEWNGESLAGKRLFVWREQGVGDEFLFASCYPDVIRHAGHVVIECDRRLVPLFARSFPRATVRAEQPMDAHGGVETVNCDYHVPAGSLPRLLRQSVGDFPPRSRWLEADAGRVADWQDRLENTGHTLRVGVSWRSAVMTADRRGAYLPLESMAALFAVPGVTLVNVQYDECAEELRAASARFNRPILGWSGLDLRNDFEETAALLSSLDLVIAPANSVGELAGALGVPVWRFCRPDWTRLGTAGRPWYPSMRVYHPMPGEDLAAAVGRMAVDLRRLVERAGEDNRPANHRHKNTPDASSAIRLQ